MKGGRPVGRKGGIESGRIVPPYRRTALPTVGIIGPGRAGVGLALALRQAGVRVIGLHGRRRKSVPRGLTLSVGGVAPWLARADVVLLAVRDDSLGPLVSDLARSGAVRRGQVFLHLSGALPAAVLQRLKKRGAHAGAMHPLMTVSADPRRAAEHVRGATFALEGDAASLRAARAIARRLGGVPVVIASRSRARYHAGAVFASNYVVVVLAAAEQLLADAGMTRRVARRALLPLALASLENVWEVGPEAALTGPIRRGDAGTVRLHRRALAPAPRELYQAVGKAALALATRAGLSKSDARRIQAALTRGGNA